MDSHSTFRTKYGTHLSIPLNGFLHDAGSGCGCAEARLRLSIPLNGFGGPLWGRPGRGGGLSIPLNGFTASLPDSTNA